MFHNVTSNVCQVNRKCFCCSTAGWPRPNCRRTTEEQEVRQDPLLQSPTSSWSIPQFLVMFLSEILSEEAGWCNAWVISIYKPRYGFLHVLLWRNPCFLLFSWKPSYHLNIPPALPTCHLNDANCDQTISVRSDKRVN